VRVWGLLEKKLAIIPDATLPHPCPSLEELLKSVSGEDAMDIPATPLAKTLQILEEWVYAE